MMPERHFSLGEASTFTYLFFQDITDADNLMSIVAFMHLFGKPTPVRPLHFVLTSRPENFRFPKFMGPASMKFPGVRPTSWESVDEDDSRLLAEDSARRIITFFHKHYGIGADMAEAHEIVRVYDGGWPAQSSNLGHALHARDFLFDRKDLVTHDMSDLGQLITGAEYSALQKHFNAEVGLNEEGKLTQDSESVEHRNARRAQIRAAMTRAKEHFASEAGVEALRPLDDLVGCLRADKQKKPLIAFVMAALTGMQRLFEKAPDVMHQRLKKIFGQLFAWDNLAPTYYTMNAEAKNIFKNQFNVDCDTDSIQKVFKELPKCSELDTLFVVPTEVTKGRKEQEDLYKQLHSELMQLEYDLRTPLQKLYGLWNEAKQNVPQPIFDPAVIFLAHTIKMKGWDIDARPLLMDKHEVSFWMFPGDKFDWDRPVFAIRQDDAKAHEVFATDEPGRGVFSCILPFDWRLRNAELLSQNHHDSDLNHSMLQ
jgi:hypothetical protein